MEKYLYLTELSWVEPWVNGGVIPLKCASSYKSIERHGIFTPDENLIDTSTHDINQFASAISIENSSVTFLGGEINGIKLPNVMKIERKTEDGLVLCLANRRSNYIAKRLGKKACVKIFNIFELKEVLDEQIGVFSLMDKCEYTKTHLRNHFLKSELDSWQEEYRLFWPGVEAAEVKIKKNMAMQIPIRGSGY
ncbi:hypothetical protein HXX54_12945 [Klebsiella pneumoniae]|uniref:hypothetical protein n=1 Tax=Klebsiella pneumoniae TaxID=573 RepID=UPI0010D639C1|nr:hypothetical protein [Klebsiella pneumoniae]MBP3130886.1 hypothetical protein [Klebsiella pneumoniae]MBP3145538.1 hypothetical protein [Klebsiella pneumoniae]VTN25065.1 Uncharacterised protein [Klebsiella pneumoniae]HCA9548793.1 hypothetical protein [Klebsiella pneumoniae]